MSKVALPYLPRLRRIFHPSDFSLPSEIAFVHALKFALAAKAELNILHAARDTERVDWTDFPGVRDTLKRWSVLPPGASEKDVARLGIRVRKVVIPHSDPIRASVRFLRKHPADLVVLATSRRIDRTREERSPVAEPIARAAGEMTLFIPHGVDGFVAREDGSVGLHRILMAVARDSGPAVAFEAVRRICAAIGATAVRCIALHVGDAAHAPELDFPEIEGWTRERIVTRGPVVPKILETAAEVRADLLVMTTAGRDGFLDAMRGSTTEQVLREAPCPLLAIPRRFAGEAPRGLRGALQKAFNA